MALLSIVFLYLGVGILAAVGTVAITQARFSARAEHRFFALLLIPVAAIYLAFVSYFGVPAARPVELTHLAVLSLVALLGLRFPLLVVAGYALHGAWDLLHEVPTLRAAVAPQVLTPIPLAYGAFCAAYDWCIAGYLLRGRTRVNG